MTATGANKKFVVRLPATATMHVDWTGSASSSNDLFASTVKYDSPSLESIVLYEWDLSTLATSWIGSATVTKLELEYYHYEADSGTLGPAGDWYIDYVSDGSAKPSPLSAALQWAAVKAHGVNMITDAVKGDQKSLRRVILGDGSTAVGCAELTDRLDETSWFAIGIEKADITDGQMKVGGLIMAKGVDSAWQTATGAFEPNGPPELIVTLEIAPSWHIRNLMKYTTADPTVDQNTPSNSIGGYSAPNNVYTRAQINEAIGSLQTTIPISTTSPSALPTTTGLALVGPEIIKFEGIDSTNTQLTGVTRGVSPPFSYPAAVSPYAEYVHYLEIDNLFDRRPSSSLVQYRCVSIAEFIEYTNYAQTSRNVKVYLVQDPDAEVQIDIGIEVPKHDYIGPFALAGGVSLKAAITEGDSILTSDDAIWAGYADGFFNGSYIVIDPDSKGGASGRDEAIIESFEVTGGTAEFIVDSSLGAHDLGEEFEVHPAPAQIISNEAIAPTENSGRFFGFLQDGGSNDISFENIRQRGGQMIHNDVIYVWIKRTLQSNAKSKADTGAVIITVFDDIDIS